MKKDIIKKIKYLVLKGDFSSAYELTIKIDDKELYNLLFDISEIENITTYSFIYYLINNNNLVIYHEVASTILTFPTLFIDGFYDVGVFHAKEAMLLAPNNINFKYNLLSLYGIPGIPITNNLFMKVINEILKIDPNNELALSSKKKINLQDEQMISFKKEKTILNLILEADYNTVFHDIKNMKCNDLLNMLLYNDINLTFYSLILYMLNRTKDTKYHTCAIILLLKQYKEINGAMEVGVFHFKELSTVDINLKFLLEYLSIETVMNLFNKANININDFRIN